MLHLNEDFVYRSPKLDERYMYLVFMTMVNNLSDQSRLSRMIKHIVDNIDQVNYTVTTSGLLRELARIEDPPEGSVNAVVEHSRKLITKLQPNMENFRDRDPSIIAQILGSTFDLGMLKHLLNPEVCEAIGREKKLMNPKYLLVNADTLSTSESRHLPIFKELVDEIIEL